MIDFDFETVLSVDLVLLPVLRESEDFCGVVLLELEKNCVFVTRLLGGVNGGCFVLIFVPGFIDVCSVSSGLTFGLAVAFNGPFLGVEDDEELVLTVEVLAWFLCKSFVFSSSFAATFLFSFDAFSSSCAFE